MVIEIVGKDDLLRGKYYQDYEVCVNSKRRRLKPTSRQMIWINKDWTKEDRANRKRKQIRH
jgi:hypothetical protein